MSNRNGGGKSSRSCHTAGTPTDTQTGREQVFRVQRRQQDLAHSGTGQHAREAAQREAKQPSVSTSIQKPPASCRARHDPTAHHTTEEYDVPKFAPSRDSNTLHPGCFTVRNMSGYLPSQYVSWENQST